MKRTKVFLGAFLILCFMAAPVFAGTTYFNHSGGNYTIAYEALGQARTITAAGSAGAGNFSGTDGAPIVFLLGQNLTSASLLNIQLGGGMTFAAGTYNVCALNAATGGVSSSNSISIGTAPIAAGVSNQNFVLNVATSGAGITAGNWLYLTSQSCANTSSNVSLVVPAASSAGKKDVTGMIKIVSEPVDTSTAANYGVWVVNEFASTLSANDLFKIDYLASPYNGTLFDLSNVGTSTTVRNNLVGTNGKLGVTNATAPPNFRTGATDAVNGSVTLSQFVTLSDSANWVGVSKVYMVSSPNAYGTAGNCFATTGSNVVANNTAPAGNITLAAAGNSAFNGAVILSSNAAICVQVTGNTVLPSRVISGGYSYNATSGGQAPAGESGKTFQAWIPNGYQAFQPYMYVGVSDTDDVFVRLYNNSSRAAYVFVDVYPNDGTAKQSLTLDSIGSNAAGTYWARTIGASAGYATGTSYAAQFTVTAPVDKVNGVSFMKRSSGGERQMPLYKGTNNPNEYLFE